MEAVASQIVNEMYKNPLWQRKRLCILQRDDWTCQKCRSVTKNLQVHHKYYKKWGTPPWEYPDEALITYCDDCHEDIKTNDFPMYQSLLRDLHCEFDYEELSRMFFALAQMTEILSEMKIPRIIHSRVLFDGIRCQPILELMYEESQDRQRAITRSAICQREELAKEEKDIPF